MGWIVHNGVRIDYIPAALFYDCRIPVLAVRAASYMGRFWPGLPLAEETALAPAALMRTGCRMSVPGSHFHRVDYLPAAG